MSAHPVAGGEDSITNLLGRVGQGDPEAASLLAPLIYGELRHIAGRYMSRERQNHTLEPTALVNEAYAKLLPNLDITWQGRSHFYAVASQQMRRILVDHARAKSAEKRGGPQQQITLVDFLAASQVQDLNILAVNEALDHLTEFAPRQGKIVEMHFFGGVAFEEIAELLNVTTRTVSRDWSMARAWLRAQLSQEK